MTFSARPSEIRTAIEGLFPKRRVSPGLRWWPGEAPEVRSLVSLLMDLDARLLYPLERLERIDFERARTALHHGVERWAAGANDRLSTNSAETIYRLLEKCPDDIVTESSTRLGFVRDEALRNSIATDADSVPALLAAEEWKAATVVGGSVVEAILLAKLEEHGPEVACLGLERGWRGGAEEWGLEKLIQAARTLNVITPTEATACGMAQYYRNLIHPGNARARQSCTRGTALATQAAMELLLEKWGTHTGGEA